MEIIPTAIEGLFEVIPQTYRDNRGWFLELFKTTFLREIGWINPPTKDNLSLSQKGIIRGLHFQAKQFGQAKLVTVLQGKVLDVVVDLRKYSTTFGKIFSCFLDSERHNMLAILEGFAHGFAPLADSSFFYKCSKHYHQGSETGIIWNDPQLKIDWRVEQPSVSEKDRQLPTLDVLLRKSLISPNL